VVLRDSSAQWASTEGWSVAREGAGRAEARESERWDRTAGLAVQHQRASGRQAAQRMLDLSHDLARGPPQFAESSVTRCRNSSK
jgi:hypothetical protein